MFKFMASFGLGGALAFLQAPYSWPAILVFLLFIPFISFNRNQKNSLHFVLGLALGFGYFAAHLSWLIVVGTDAWLGLAFFCSIWWGFANLFANLKFDSKYWKYWFASSWSVFEIIRDHIPWGGFGWGQLGLLWIDSPISGLYASLGQIGMTWLTYFLIATFYKQIIRNNTLKLSSKVTRSISSSIALVLLANLSINWQPVSTDEKDSITVAGIQGGVEHYGIGAGSDPYAILNRHIAQTLTNKTQVNASDLVIWPESSVDKDPNSDALTMEKLLKLDSEIIPPVLVGTTIYDENNFKSNSSQILDAGGLKTVYEKRHLVPFGEFLPLRNLIENYTDRASLLAHDFKPGSHPGILEIRDLQLAVLICFEVADESLALENIETKSAIIIPTNNATYQNLGQTEQQAVYSRIRAIETGRKVLSIATSGDSVVVSPTGLVEQRIKQNEIGVIQTEIFKTSGQTIAARIFYPIEFLIFMIFSLGLMTSLSKSRIK